MEFKPHELDLTVAECLRRLFTDLDLVYGAVDLRLTRQGEYVFLEVTPSGQYLFLELLTGFRYRKRWLCI